MPIRPIDIRRKEFRNGFRGYDPNQVDDFLDTVADEFERTYNENQRMREETNSLRERLQQFEDLEGSIRAALVHAEQAANDLRRSANREAEGVRQSARREADYTVKDAQSRSHQILADSAARIERVQDSYEALQDAKRSFGNDFRHLLKTYMDMMENMDVSSARDIEAALRDRLDTESIAVVREAAAVEEQSDSEEQPQAGQPAFGEPDASAVEDPGATARIEPEASTETAPAADPASDEAEAGGVPSDAPEQNVAAGGTQPGPLAGDALSEEDTQIMRPEEPTSPEPADDQEVSAVEEQGPADEAGTSGAEEGAEPSTARGSSEGESAAGDEAADEVESDETSLAEESRSQEFFDRENTPRERGNDSRIFRASRFLRRRE